MDCKILKLVIQSVQDRFEEESDSNLSKDVSENTRLFGPSGGLDSLGLVALITDLEERIYAEFGKEIFLADDRAMSQRFSPFRSVRSLSAYIEKLLSEHEG